MPSAMTSAMTSPLRLVLMRHAKSSWESAADTDHARPLNPRGRRDAPRVAAAIAAQGWAPDHVLSSDATRTTQTWTAMAGAFAPPALTWSRRLYLAGLDELFEALAVLPQAASCVLALGHNPGWEEALSELTGQRCAMGTGNAALLEAPAGARWATLPRRGWRLRALLRPKGLA